MFAKRIVLYAATLIGITILSACNISVKPTKPDGAIAGEISQQVSDEILASGDWIPIGSIISLNDGTQKLMIIGKVQSALSEEGNMIYDYSAVLCPQGLIDPLETIAFDKSSIKRIYFIGYIDEQEASLNQQFDEFLAENRED